MKDKEKYIKEMSKLDIEESAGFYSAFINDIRISINKPLSTSKTIMSFDCPKSYILQAIGISKDSVIISRKEWKQIKNSLYYSEEELTKKLARERNEMAENIIEYILRFENKKGIIEMPVANIKSLAFSCGIKIKD